MPVWTVVVAAGSSERFGAPKQTMPLGGARVVDHAVATAVAASDGVVLVVPMGATWTVDGVTRVEGGATRSASVRAGIAAVPDAAEIVLVHDGARPLASSALFDRVIAAVRAGADGAVPGLAMSDTVKRVQHDVVVETIPRETLVSVQTPQGFRASTLRHAHANNAEGSDDAAVVEEAGGTVVVVPGERDNFKITEPADLERAEAVLAARGIGR
jgi:2-C-methyl-D-erythritol 4-phosphate cytidylyltransferase